MFTTSRSTLSRTTTTTTTTIRTHYRAIHTANNNNNNNNIFKDESNNKYLTQRLKYKNDIDQLAEQRASMALEEFLLQSKMNATTNRTTTTPPPNTVTTTDTTMISGSGTSRPPGTGGRGEGGIFYKDGDYKHHMTNEQLLICLDGILMTFCLHAEARIASMIGMGYYTIGPCGEELLASVAHCIQPIDSVALHYRHLAINITRQLNEGRKEEERENEQIIERILLDRARGYTVSKYDPVTGGVHCSIGGGYNDYIVTSTLASQCPAAVGRALGYSIRKQAEHEEEMLLTNPSPSPLDDTHNNSKGTSRRQAREVSFVTIGDGSIHNNHFWSSYHLARHVRHKYTMKCPIVFGITDNQLSISYNTAGYCNTLFGNNTISNANSSSTSSSIIDPLIPVYHVNGIDMMDIYSQTYDAIQHSRIQSTPVVILYQNIVRRFGHAATDRQFAYLKQDIISSMQQTTIIEDTITRLIEHYNCGMTYSEILDRFLYIRETTKLAFAQASIEEKVNRQDMLNRVQPSLVPIAKTSTSPSSLKSFASEDNENHCDDNDNDTSIITATLTTKTAQAQAPATTVATRPKHKHKPKSKPKKNVMRKHMTSVIQEIMDMDNKVIYMGEDVRHGGYYVVTEGIVDRYPSHRILDFPPDENSLLGAALGFSQLGLLPIVEIPYAKYLDCAIDTYNEIAIMNWLSSSNGNNINIGGSNNNNNNMGTGMIIRLQGFDRGIFGGNFHTNNTLQHIPPGIDVVCYSNGADYVRGWRYLYYQAKYAQRIIVSVDCTHLLNLRHVYDSNDGGGSSKRDRLWETTYPSLLIKQQQQNDDEDDDDDNEVCTSCYDYQYYTDADVMSFQQVRKYIGRRQQQQQQQGDDDDKEGGEEKSPFIVVTEGCGDDSNTTTTTTSKAKWLIVTYGNGVITALQARKEMVATATATSSSSGGGGGGGSGSHNDNILDGIITSEADIDIIDCPYISDVPDGLRNVITGTTGTSTTTTTSDTTSSLSLSSSSQYRGILFADICKDGPTTNVLSNFAIQLYKEGFIGSSGDSDHSTTTTSNNNGSISSSSVVVRTTPTWDIVCAPRTYNPLGNTCTFLNVYDIIEAFHRLVKRTKQ